VSSHRQDLGKTGEELAVRELLARGYAILYRRYRTRYGEIDIIAEHQGTIVFIEVKARVTREFGGAAAAVTPYKQRRLTAMAIHYLSVHRLGGRPCRFEVVAIDVAEGRKPEVRLFAGAFDAVW
jgi:putative endonuclease